MFGTGSLRSDRKKLANTFAERYRVFLEGGLDACCPWRAKRMAEKMFAVSLRTGSMAGAKGGSGVY
jgi:hypothetical protein